MRDLVETGLTRRRHWLRTAPAAQRRTRLKNARVFLVAPGDPTAFVPLSWVLLAGENGDLDGTAASAYSPGRWASRLAEAGFRHVRVGAAEDDPLYEGLRDRVRAAGTNLSARSDPTWAPSEFWVIN